MRPPCIGSYYIKPHDSRTLPHSLLFLWPVRSERSRTSGEVEERDSRGFPVFDFADVESVLCSPKGSGQTGYGRGAAQVLYMSHGFFTLFGVTIAQAP